MNGIITVVLSVLLVAFTFGIGRAVAVSALRLSVSTSVQRQVVRGCRIGVWLVAVSGAVAVSTTLSQTTLDVLPADWQADTPIVVLGYTGMALIAAVSIVAGKRGLAPLERAVTDYDHTVDPRLRRRERIAFVALLIGTALIVALASVEEIAIGFEWVLPTAGVLLVGYVHTRLPRSIPGYRTRDATADERDRIERCYETFDRSPGRIVVVDDVKRPLSVIVGGHGETKWLWIRESLLETADDETLTIALAQADAKKRRYFWATYPVHTLLVATIVWLWLEAVGIGTGVPLVSLPSSSAGSASVVVGCIGVLILETQLRRKITYRADDEVASQFGAERVVAVYDRIDELRFVVVGLDHAISWLASEPTTDDRIQQLQNRQSIETERPDDDRSSETERRAAPHGTVDRLAHANSGQIWPLLTFGSAVVWTVLVFAPADLPESTFNVGFFMAWFGIPLGIYLDARRLRSIGQWPTRPKTVTALSAVWFLNVPVALWYVWKRRRVSTETNGGNTDASTNGVSDPIDSDHPDESSLDSGR